MIRQPYDSLDYSPHRNPLAFTTAPQQSYAAPCTVIRRTPTLIDVVRATSSPDGGYPDQRSSADGTRHTLAPLASPIGSTWVNVFAPASSCDISDSTRSARS